MTAKSEKAEQKPNANENSQGVGTMPPAGEIAEDTLDMVVGGAARRGPRMS